MGGGAGRGGERKSHLHKLKSQRSLLVAKVFNTRTQRTNLLSLQRPQRHSAGPKLTLGKDLGMKNWGRHEKLLKVHGPSRFFIYIDGYMKLMDSNMFKMNNSSLLRSTTKGTKQNICFYTCKIYLRLVTSSPVGILALQLDGRALTNLRS